MNQKKRKPAKTKKSAVGQQADMFADTYEDMALFSGTAGRPTEAPEEFKPAPADRQLSLPDIPAVDWEAVRLYQRQQKQKGAKKHGQ